MKTQLGSILPVLLTSPGNGIDFTAPLPPDEALALMPVQTDSFSSDLWKLVRNALDLVLPEIGTAAGVCMSLVAISMLVSILRHETKSSKAVVFAGSVATSLLLFGSAGTMIQLGAETVRQISNYGKLLLPVLTAAMAAEGRSATSAALYAGTAAFDAILTAVISGVLLPVIYVFLVLSVVGLTTGESVILKIRDFSKWAATWMLKVILYIFTGFMGITGVVSGAVDKTALKAAKLTISGMVPVVGGILSDASEAVLVSVGLMKNAAGIYGMLSLTAILLAPFLRIGIQYLLLKATAGVCTVFGVKQMSDIIQTFSSAMGLLLGMTGTVCVLQLISTICFMKGVA